MARRRLKSVEWPDDSFLEYEIATDGSATIEVAMRYEGRRNFDRIRIRLSPKDTSAMLEKMRRDVGWSKLHQPPQE